jgi:hypothetical protein
MMDASRMRGVIRDAYFVRPLVYGLMHATSRITLYESRSCKRGKIVCISIS